MVKEIEYTSIRRVLDNLLDHPLLKDLNLDQVIRYTIRFISIHGYPKLYVDKIQNVVIKDFRGELPCDLISIIQVKDVETGVCLRHMTDNFTPALSPQPRPPHGYHKDLLHNVEHPEHPEHSRDMYIPPMRKYMEEPAFKTQGRCIFTSFPEGLVEIAYKAIPVDSEGFPLLIDNENYLAALEAYIKKQVFTIKFDQQKINAQVLQNAQTDYAWLAGQLNSEFCIPSVSEAEAISRAMTALVPRMREFDNGFKNLGDREYLQNHHNQK